MAAGEVSRELSFQEDAPQPTAAEVAMVDEAQVDGPWVVPLSSLERDAEVIRLREETQKAVQPQVSVPVGVHPEIRQGWWQGIHLATNHNKRRLFSGKSVLAKLAKEQLNS